MMFLRAKILNFDNTAKEFPYFNETFALFTNNDAVFIGHTRPEVNKKAATR